MSGLDKTFWSTVSYPARDAQEIEVMEPHRLAYRLEDIAKETINGSLDNYGFTWASLHNSIYEARAIMELVGEWKRKNRRRLDVREKKNAAALLGQSTLANEFQTELEDAVIMESEAVTNMRKMMKRIALWDNQSYSWRRNWKFSPLP